ncbi:DUF7210 family protein [Undibacterium sp. TJN19]|uniref:DUF7210 family protein n=1 Tax=Undibacterium sp. TJN19 TaxID=3413055 RepID=UPI003BF0AD29
MTTTSQNLVKVALKKSHTHAGTTYEEGKEIVVSQLDADWLASNAIGEVVPGEKEAEAENQGPPRGKAKT